MGTTYNIRYLQDISVDPNQLKTTIDEALIELNAKMSTYINDSELSTFNKSNSTQWQPIGPELLFVVNHALAVAKKTEGTFDPTIGPLVNLWGFGPSGKRKVPTDIEISETKKRVGFQKIQINEEKSLWRKNTADVYVDLSASAKGYGVDKVAKLLLNKGLSNFMVEIGGEIRTSGSKNGKPWVIAIESPSRDKTKKSYQKLLKLNSMAMATSGNYRNFFKEGKKHYSHTINFKTGKPISHTLASVSVVDKESCMNADALATALMAMGLDNGLKIAEKLNIPAYFIYKLDSQDDFLVAESSEFKKLFK
jgi:thiamine biosynthesis lipoprotein